jgi:chromosomal replication initiator protein
MPHLKFEEKAKVQVMKMIVSCEFKLGVHELEGPERSRRVSWPRAVAMQILYKDGDISLEKIGHAFGGRDHSTVANAVTRADDYCADDLEMFLRRRTIRDRFKHITENRKEVA